MTTGHPKSAISNQQSAIILGVRIHDVTAAETLALVESFVAAGMPHQICTANPEFVMKAQTDDEFRRILNGADLCLPDGIGLVWASRLLRQPVRERVAGSDMLPMLSAQAAQQGWRVFYLGAAEGIAERTARLLQGRHPGLTVVGTLAGSPHPEDEADILARVRAARPDILFVAYGAPAQDKWIARNRDRLAVPVMLGVGGAFDFIAGTALRAPRWMQAMGLEWLHRLLMQPWRWRRMLALPRFVVRVLRESRP